MAHAYLWIAIVGGIFSFLVACGNGANDLANSFGTSYGSRVMTLLQIIILASICEFGGAVGLGSGVTTTISSGIARGSVFSDDPSVLMYGFLCTLISTAIWLFLATWKDLTVSSHQSIAGGIIGFALVYGGGDAVIWASTKKDFPYVGGMVPIVLSWIISPPLSAAASMVIYAAVRYLLLQRSYAVRLAVPLFPLIAGLSVFLEFLFIFLIVAQNRLSWSPSRAIWVAAVIGLGAALICIPLMPVLRRAIDTMVRDAMTASRESGLTVKNAMRNILSKGRPYVDGGNQSTVNPSENKSVYCDPNTMPGAANGEDAHSHAVSYANDGIMSGNAAVYVHPSNTISSDGKSHNDVNRCSNNSSAHHGNTFGDRVKQLDAPSAAVGAVVSADDCSGADESHTGEAMTREEEHLAHRPSHTRQHSVSSAAACDDAGASASSRRPQSRNDGEEESAPPQFTRADAQGHWIDIQLEDEHDASGVRLFDPRAEYIFRYLQIFTAASMSLAHGANDVSNAIGPFSAIHEIYSTGNVASTIAVPIWLLCMGGVGIIVGLSTYGLNIMRLLGEKLAFITPVRGFSAELATALVVSFATIYSLPVSTTQCVTGAVIGVNMLDVGLKGLKWRIITRVYLGWVATLIISGAISGLLFAQGIHAPSQS